MSQSAITHDVLVIGAGPAGAAAAYVAANAGLKTAVIDKARFPRDKLCGGGFTGRSAKYFEEIFERPVPEHFDRKTRVAFHAFGEALGDLKDLPPFYLTMRLDLDNLLFGYAISAGAADFTGRRINKLDADQQTVRLADGTVLRGRILIGADGVSSPTARSLFGKAFDRSNIGFGFEIEADPISPDAPMRIDFGQAMWGYGWSFPKSGSHTVGVGGVLSKNPDLRDTIDRYAAELRASSGCKVKGAYLPFGRSRPRPGRGATLLAGDAAWLVDPITGEGIAYAMKSGQEAALAAAAALRRHEPTMAYTLYRHRIRPMRWAIAQAALLRPIIYWGPCRQSFIQGLRGSGTLRYDYMRLVAGEIEYPDILTKLLRRLPRFVARAVFATSRDRQAF